MIMQKLNNIYHILFVTGLLCCSSVAFAQTGNKFIRKGNELYQQKQYTDAEANYKKALEQNQQSDVGRYNLGNSLYEQKRYDDARTQYTNSVKLSKDKTVKSDANYNIGNTYMEGKKWEESIKAYKQSLKMNPADEEARYNLAYAQSMLKKQQQGGGGNNKDNKENKDKDKKKQDQQNQNQNKDQQQQNKQDQQDKNKEQQDQKPQPQPSKLDKQEAERLLQALNQEEKKLQDKMKKVKGQPVQVEKDW
jgi:tetratricopeptide (TPR) repeat protein